MSTEQDLIKQEEGFRAYAYQDSLGFWTIGYGHLIDVRKGGQMDADLLLTQLQRDITRKAGFLNKNIVYNELGSYQQAALVSMAFQLGEAGINAFHEMWSKLAQRDYQGAAEAALNSDWAKQTPARAQREARMLQTNAWVAAS